MSVSKKIVNNNLSNIFCLNPFIRLEIHQGGGIFVCCPTWLPTEVGNISNMSLREAMESPKVKEIQLSIQNGSFKFCERDFCPNLSKYLKNGKDDFPVLRKERAMSSVIDNLQARRLTINLCYDTSCNLSCPSCRNEMRFFSEKNTPDYLIDFHNKTLKSIKELQDLGYQIELGVTGSGDAFASHLYSKFLFDLEFDSKLKLNIQTNGLLMNETKFSPSMYKMLSTMSVSVDAFSAETYSKIRRNGNFEILKKNLNWFNRAVLDCRFPKLELFQVNFVVQKDNFREIEPFIKWMLSYPSIDKIWLNLISDWGHLSKKEFDSRAVWKKTHPEHKEFLEVVNAPFLQSTKKINIGNLSGFLY